MVNSLDGRGRRAMGGSFLHVSRTAEMVPAVGQPLQPPLGLQLPEHVCCWPPTKHWPEEHVFGAVQTFPLQEPGWQTVPLGAWPSEYCVWEVMHFRQPTIWPFG